MIKKWLLLAVFIHFSVSSAQNKVIQEKESSVCEAQNIALVLSVLKNNHKKTFYRLVSATFGLKSVLKRKDYKRLRVHNLIDEYGFPKESIEEFFKKQINLILTCPSGIVSKL